MNADQTKENSHTSALIREKEVLGSAPCKRQQSDIPRLLDRRAQPSLMRRAHTRQPARYDLSTLGDELREQAHVFVIDRFNLLGAELAHFLAAEVFAAAGPTAFASPSRPRWTALAAPMSFRGL